MIKPPLKGVVRRSSFNMHMRAAQNYSIVEDLAQAPSTMSALDVIQTCPMQQRAFSMICGIDPSDANMISF
jgi:hypothetical protein